MIFDVKHKQIKLRFNEGVLDDWETDASLLGISTVLAVFMGSSYMELHAQAEWKPRSTLMSAVL